MDRESSVSLRRTTTVTSDGDECTISTNRYNVYRGMSPTTQSRLEAKMREMEGMLEAEREARMRAERDVTELSMQLEAMSERIDEADGLTSAQAEVTRKREGEIMKVRKDFELLATTAEVNESTIRKRHVEQVNELSETCDAIAKKHNKAEKERQQLLVELDSANGNIESIHKMKLMAESRAETLDEQLRRMKTQADELMRQNNDLNGFKARLTQENFELQKQVQDLDNTAGALSKAKSALQAALDDTKNKLDEEIRQRNLLQIQLNTMQVDFENLSASYEEEAEAANSLRNANVKLTADMHSLKQRYDKELAMKAEELDDFRRKMNIRLNELEGVAETLRSKCGKLEKEKGRLVVEIKEISMELETANAHIADLTRRLKQADTLNVELQRRVDELSADLAGMQGENNRLNGEVVRLKAAVGDLSDKNDQLGRENRQLAEALRESNLSNKELNKQVVELTSIRVSLEAEREQLSVELSDTREAFKDAQMHLESSLAANAALRSEMEARLREKDNEIEAIRKSGQRALDELQRTLVEIETKYKGELSRLRKKYEAEMRELEIQVETLNRTNMELAKANKSLSAKAKELEIQLDEERRAGDEARQAVTLLERKRIALTAELEDVRGLLETAERARKNAEAELYDSHTRINELNIMVSTLTGDKRRLETDLTAMVGDLDEAVNGRRASDERADRLQLEVNRLVEELKSEQENYRNAEALRKQLEIEIREITVRLEEAEAFAQREGKRVVAKLQARLRDLETELEAEQRRSRDFMNINRKLERSFNELRAQADDDRRMVIELQDQMNAQSIKCKTIRRQLEEAEEVVQITMNKYRKAQTVAEEAEHRAQMAETNSALRNRNRSMSVSREITRVVRV